jgi:predicted ATPase/class 3 adenylate cyclase
MASALPIGTVTFLFTDIEGSTRLLHYLGDRYAQVLRDHHQLLRQAFVQHGGGEVDTQGDSFFVAFATAPSAVAAAAAATRAVAAHTWPEGVAVRVRMGLHTGAPQLVGDRYVGLDVHRAARIAAAGHGGQILLSESTRVLATQDLPTGASLRDLGTYRLKDLQHPESITQLTLAELPSDFPPLKTLDRRTHNLPIQPTLLLGREKQEAALSGFLRRGDARLVTVTGAGGIGKTRLALQVAAEVLEDFPDGVWLVRLSRLTDPELVLPTIAQTIGVKEAPGQPIVQTLGEYLHAKQLLLLLDNFEQIVSAAPVVGKLLEDTPGLRILATSRVPLRLRGEQEYPLVPLPLPDPSHLPTAERLTQYAAVALFVERAAAVRPDFLVTDTNAPAIAEICARLDGLPLAIELAAARVKLLSPEALLSRLSSQLQVLTGGARDLEARQQTMRATIGWSVALLGPVEQVLFRRLAVFAGGGTLEATQAVCVAPEGVEPLGLDLLDGLGALVDQSLVQQREEGNVPRFGMLQVIREFALEQLMKSDEATAVWRAHTAYYLSLAERLEPQLSGPDQVELLTLLEREHDNLRAVFDRSLKHDAAEAARLCVALLGFLSMSGHVIELGQWSAQALLHAGTLPPRLHARLLVPASVVARTQGNYAAATQHLEQGLALFRSVGDTAGVADVLGQLAGLALEQDHFDQAEQLFDESLQLLREVGDRPAMLQVLEMQAYLPVLRGDAATTKKLLEQGLELAQDLKDTHDIASIRDGLGLLELLAGNDAGAEALLQQALGAQQQLGDTNCSAISLGYLGLLALECGDASLAQDRLNQSRSLFQDIDNQVGVGSILVWLGLALLAAGNVEEAEAAYLECLRIQHKLGHKQRIAASLEALAETALVRGYPRRAAWLLGAATQTQASIGVAPVLLPPRLAAEREQVTTRVRQALGATAWEEAYASGAALPLDKAVAEAIAPAFD